MTKHLVLNYKDGQTTYLVGLTKEQANKVGAAMKALRLNQIENKSFPINADITIESTFKQCLVVGRIQKVLLAAQKHNLIVPPVDVRGNDHFYCYSCKPKTSAEKRGVPEEVPGTYGDPFINGIHRDALSQVNCIKANLGNPEYALICFGKQIESNVEDRDPELHTADQDS